MLFKLFSPDNNNLLFMGQSVYILSSCIDVTTCDLATFLNPGDLEKCQRQGNIYGGKNLGLSLSWHWRTKGILLARFSHYRQQRENIFFTRPGKSPKIFIICWLINNIHNKSACFLNIAIFIESIAEILLQSWKVSKNLHIMRKSIKSTYFLWFWQHYYHKVRTVLTIPGSLLE